MGGIRCPRDHEGIASAEILPGFLFLPVSSDPGSVAQSRAGVDLAGCAAAFLAGIVGKAARPHCGL